MIYNLEIREIHELINEFKKIRDNAGSNDSALAEVALFVENIFGIYLSDDDICKENFGTFEATENFIIQRLAE